MKKPMNKITLAVVGLAGVLYLSACDNNAKTSDTADSTRTETATAAATGGDGHEHTYACPMHPEVTGKEGDKCPKCGMDLVHNDNAGNTNKYTMAFKSDPEQVAAGKEAVFSFTPAIKGKDGEAVPLDVEHDKKIHLIVVSKDLSYFDHNHPEYQTSGSYDISVVATGKPYARGSNQTRFSKGGDYIMFADYLPTGGNHQVEKIELNVAGTPYKPVTFSAAKLSSVVEDGYGLTLEPEGGKFESGRLMHMQGIVKLNGKEIPADQLENYLGAKAHMVVIGVEQKDYLHVHPDVENGRLDLHTTFDKPGIYRAWIQFQAKGKVYTTDFVINVAQAAATTQAEKPADHSGH